MGRRDDDDGDGTTGEGIDSYWARRGQRSSALSRAFAWRPNATRPGKMTQDQTGAKV